MAQLIIIKIANGKIASNTLTVTRFMRLWCVVANRVLCPW
jgi:hypothetical protein